MPEPKTQISIRVDVANLNELDRLADEEDRSRSWLIDKAVEEYLKQRGRLPRKPGSESGKRAR